MSIFDKEQSFSREELKNISKKDSGLIPKTGGEKYYQKDREDLIKKSFGSKYGSEISKNDYRSVVNNLKHEQSRMKSGAEKDELNKKISYMKKLGGIK